MTDFLTGVGQLKFRGTSHLLRAPFSIMMVVDEDDDSSEESEKSSAISPNTERKRARNKVGSPEPERMMSFDALLDDEDISFLNADFAQDSNYDLATHVVQVKRTGQVTDIKSLWDFEGDFV